MKSQIEKINKQMEFNKIESKKKGKVKGLISHKI
jgi:hypothetical protein